MKILLVNPPVRIFVRFLPPHFPLGLGYIAAMLAKDGHNVEIYDAEWDFVSARREEDSRYLWSEVASNGQKYFEALENPAHEVWQKVQEVIRLRDPELIGITCRMLDLPSALVVAGIAKSVKKDVVVVLGGPAATTCTDYVLQDHNIDFAVRGEGENTTALLVKALQSPQPGFRTIDGLSFREADGIVHNHPRALIEDIGSLPYPARDLLLYSDELPVAMYKRMMGEVITSRGCPYACTFCANYSVWGSRRARMRTAEDVVQEVLYLRDTYGAEGFTFWDDLFTVNTKRTVEICRLLLERKANVWWIALVRADTINENLLMLMQRAGCREVQMGVESGSNRILAKLDKRETVEEIGKAAKIIRKVGIPWRAFLIMGIPTETREEMAATMALIPVLKPNAVDLNVFSPFPGSPLYEELKKSADLTWKEKSSVDMINPAHCYTGTMSSHEFHELALRYLRECDEYNWKMSHPSGYAYYLRHPIGSALRAAKKLY